ncbi:mobile element protein [Geminocystis sp. NIES-3709]|nr:mobile element protein [Geminocystis sp. NIES-3709]
MYGAYRRSFQAQMCLKYCRGSARKAERTWGWGRENVQLGLEEERTGIICLGAQSMSSGMKKWEQKCPDVAIVLREIAEAHCQQEPSFKTSIAYTRLTASEAIAQLKQRGFSEEEIPVASTMATILNRMGYRLRKIVKAKPQKKFQRPMPSLKM